jgi:outer membrane protein TolC
MKRARPVGVLAALALCSACTVGPDYHRPSAPVPAQYEEAGWKIGEPLDAIDRGALWSIYKDPVLDGLAKHIDISNQNLKAAAAAFQQAEWIAAQARAGFFPTATVDASAQRSRSSAGSVVVGRGIGGIISNQFSTSTSASWTPDFWGKVRRAVESEVASPQASAGDLATARLSAQGALASDYLQLRVADELKRLIDPRQRLMRNRCASRAMNTLRALLRNRMSPRPRPSCAAHKRRRSRSG